MIGETEVIAGVLEVETRVVGGRRLRVGRSRGAERSHPLVIFNGIGASLELVGVFARALSAHGIGVITFDVPGIGGSEMPARPYRFGDLARLTTDLLDDLDVALVDVAGMSWGGAVAQEFAFRFPHRVRRLVLAATSAGALAVPGKWSALKRLAIPRRFTVVRDQENTGAVLFGGRFRSDPALFASIAPFLRASHGRGYALQILAGAGWTSAPWLHKLVQPTLVVMGTDDPIVPTINGKLLTSLIPKARLFTIDDGHLFVVTRPEQTAKLLADFLDARPYRAARR